MAGEIHVVARPGAAVYVLVRDPIGRAWSRNSGQFEEVLATKWTSYAIATTEARAASGVHRAAFPPAAAGTYEVVPYEMRGVTPLPTDPEIGLPETIVWDGSRATGSPREVVAPPGRNMLRKGLRWLSDQQRDHSSEDVIYAQSDGTLIHCRAMLGNKLFRIDTGDGGYRVEQSDMDFLIHRSEIPWIEPQRGDLIYLDIEGTTQTFEVAPYGGDPPWRYADPHESMLRIHTKLVTTEPHVVWP